MNNYRVIVGPSLSYNIKRAMICELFVANPPDSQVVLYWSVSLVLDGFWSSGHYCVYHKCSLWNWAEEKSPREYVN